MFRGRPTSLAKCIPIRSPQLFLHPQLMSGKTRPFLVVSNLYSSYLYLLCESKTRNRLLPWRWPPFPLHLSIHTLAALQLCTLYQHKAWPKQSASANNELHLLEFRFELTWATISYSECSCFPVSKVAQEWRICNAWKMYVGFSKLELKKAKLLWVGRERRIDSSQEDSASKVRWSPKCL